MSQKIRIAIPLSLAAVLTVLFVFLVLSELQDPATEEPGPEARQEPAEGVPQRPVARGDIPTGPPSEPRRRVQKRRVPAADGFSRWHLPKLPPNWNAELAKDLHTYFELLDKYERGRSANSAALLMKKREELREFLAGLGPESLETLSMILNSEPDFVYRRFMLAAIGDLGPKTEGATWALRDYFVARQSNPGHRSEMGYLINAMGKLQNDTSYDVLQDLIKNPGFSPYRDKFIWELGEHHRRDEALDFFNDGLNNETSKRNRNKYAQALGKIASPESLPQLYHAFKNENYWVNKQTILGSIGKIGNPNSIPFLAEQARYAGESAVRLSAARALSRIGTPVAMDTLRDVAQSESDEKIQSYMINWSQEQQ